MDSKDRDISQLCHVVTEGYLSPLDKKASPEEGQLFSRGDGRTRTAVQPNHQYAFYMLILSLVVGKRLPKDRPPQPYPLGLGVL